MKMSEEMALKLHRMMWSDMRKELGDTPDVSARNKFKENWCTTHFPDEYIHFNCFLCEYSEHDCFNRNCDKCPIKWPNDTCASSFGQPPAKIDYRYTPISKILALPARNKDLADDKAPNKDGSYYEFRENMLSEYSGLPANFAIWDHVNAIREKAVDDYFAKMPLAKAITTDVDEAFKQYADEQKAPIFKELSAASELSELCHNVSEHISAIQKKSAKDQWIEDVNTLKEEAGMPYVTVAGFGSALRQKLEDCKVLSSLLKKYKDRLCYMSGLDRDKPIDYHLNKIHSDGFIDGRESAKEEIFKKVEEVLKL